MGIRKAAWGRDSEVDDSCMSLLGCPASLSQRRWTGRDRRKEGPRAVRDKCRDDRRIGGAWGRRGGRGDRLAFWTTGWQDTAGAPVNVMFVFREAVGRE